MITDMRTAQYEMSTEQWGNESDPASNWALANNLATFSHTDSCKFIFYVGSTEQIKHWATSGFSLEVIALFQQAHEANYAYICLYS